MITFDEIMKNLKAGKYAPVYLLTGGEPYYIDTIANYIDTHALSEQDAVFNKSVFYGKDSKIVDIIHEADQYPMMAERRLVMFREAQEGDKPHMEDFVKYCEHLQESTILVICFKTDPDSSNKPPAWKSKLMKAVEKVGGVAYETPRIYENQVAPWITSYVASQGLTIETKASEMMAEAIGKTLANIASTVEKLKDICHNENTKTITSDMVSKHVGISNEYNAFELKDALMLRNVSKVNRIVKAFSGNDTAHPIPAVVSVLYQAFERLFAYHYLPDKSSKVAGPALGEAPYIVVKTYEPASKIYSARKCLQVIDLLREYDMKSKGYKWPSVSNGDALKELVFRIMY